MSARASPRSGRRCPRGCARGLAAARPGRLSSCKSDPAYPVSCAAVDPQPGAPDAALQLIGERGIAHESLLRQNLDARVVRILEKIADRVGRLPVARRRRARQHFRSDAPLARYETDVAQFAQCLAHRRAADAVLLAE